MDEGALARMMGKVYRFGGRRNTHARDPAESSPPASHRTPATTRTLQYNRDRILLPAVLQVLDAAALVVSLIS